MLPISYEELVEKYRKRQKDTVIDTISVGLSYADEVAIESGLLDETGLLSELTDVLSNTLPFVVIAISEGQKVILKKKPIKTASKDLAFRMVKSGTAMSAGALVLQSVGVWPAIPVTMGVRALFDRYKSKTLTQHRVRGRISRLHEIEQYLHADTDQKIKLDSENENRKNVLNISDIIYDTDSIVE